MVERDGPTLATLGASVTQARVVLVGTVLTALAALLPWARTETPDLVVTVPGIDVDGFLTLLLAISVAGLVLVRNWERLDRIGTLLSGTLVLALAVNFLLDPVFSGAAGEQLSAADVTIAPQIGVYLTLLGGGLIVAGSLWAMIATAGGPSPTDEIP